MLHHSPDYVKAEVTERRSSGPGCRPPWARGLDETIKAASVGDLRAWSALVERFGKRVRGVARGHRLAAHDVEDVSQTTWMHLVEHIGALRDPEALGAWLETTSRRESVRVSRRAGREKVVGDPMPGEVADPTAIEDRILEADRRASLVAAYERLPARHRRLLTLLLTDPPASYAVISEALGMPIGSIGPTRARALARLRLECNPVPAFDEGRPKGDD